MYAKVAPEGTGTLQRAASTFEIVDKYHDTMISLVRIEDVEKCSDWDELGKYVLEKQPLKQYKPGQAISNNNPVLFVSHRWEPRGVGNCGYGNVHFDIYLDPEKKTKPKQFVNLKRIISTGKLDKYKYLWIDVYNEFLLPEVKVMLFRTMDLVSINFDMSHFSRAWIFFEFMSTYLSERKLLVFDTDGVHSTFFQQKVEERLELLLSIIGILGDDITIKEVIVLNADNGSLTAIWNMILSQLQDSSHFIKSLRPLRQRILKTMRVTNITDNDDQDFMLSFMSDLKKLASDENADTKKMVRYARNMAMVEKYEAKDDTPQTFTEYDFQKKLSHISTSNLNDLKMLVKYDENLVAIIEKVEESRREILNDANQLSDERKKNWKSFIGSVIVVAASIIINVVVAKNNDWNQSSVVNLVTQTAAILTTLLLGFYDLMTMNQRIYGWMVKASFLGEKIKEVEYLVDNSRRLYADADTMV